MGYLAKRRSKRRAGPRAFQTSLDFRAITQCFSSAAEETIPLVGILSKGFRPVYVEGSPPKVYFGVPGNSRTGLAQKLGVTSPIVYWVVALTSIKAGFATTIVAAPLRDGDIVHYKQYEQFHAFFYSKVAELDDSVHELQEAA